MELILTSFGLSHRTPSAKPTASSSTASTARLYSLEQARELLELSTSRHIVHEPAATIFDRLPPADLSGGGDAFVPDYSALLLCDKVILDSQSYERLTSKSTPWYGHVAETVKALNAEGFLRVEDFDALIRRHHALLERMLEQDLQALDAWVPVLKESRDLWDQYLTRMSDQLSHLLTVSTLSNFDLAHVHMRMDKFIGDSLEGENEKLFRESLKSATARRRADHRNALRARLREYLTYVNANLVLSHTLNAGFFDWQDFQPFYKHKFLSIGKENGSEERRVEAVKKLFEVCFPKLTFWTPKDLIHALKDKRIGELRALVSEAALGNVDFDCNFAMRTLTQVLKIERSLADFRKLVSYATMPLPGGSVLQKLVEEAITRPVEHRKRRGFQWFYLISDVVQNADTSTLKSDV
jgi:hypothetical protein